MTAGVPVSGAQSACSEDRAYGDHSAHGRLKAECAGSSAAREPPPIVASFALRVSLSVSGMRENGASG
jgi:hypothetical protein